MRDEMRSQKACPQWDLRPAKSGRRIDKTIEFPKGSEVRATLWRIKNNTEFIEAVADVAGQYLSRTPPDWPMPWDPKPGQSEAEVRLMVEQQRNEYRQRWLYPSPGEMRATLKDLEKIENKVAKLAVTSRTHPIWRIFKDAWRIEERGKLDTRVFDRLRIVNDKLNELENTPDDHPAKSVLRSIWDQEYRSDFDALNDRIIPGLVGMALRHLETVHFNVQTNHADEERWLAWRLGYVLKRFDIKLTCSKDGHWVRCLKTVLAHIGKPTGGAHKLITPEILKDLKRPT